MNTNLWISSSNNLVKAIFGKNNSQWGAKFRELKFDDNKIILIDRANKEESELQTFDTMKVRVVCKANSYALSSGEWEDFKVLWYSSESINNNAEVCRFDNENKNVIPFKNVPEMKAFVKHHYGTNPSWKQVVYLWDGTEAFRTYLKGTKTVWAKMIKPKEVEYFYENPMENSFGDITKKFGENIPDYIFDLTAEEYKFSKQITICMPLFKNPEESKNPEIESIIQNVVLNIWQEIQERLNSFTQKRNDVDSKLDSIETQNVGDDDEDDLPF